MTALLDPALTRVDILFVVSNSNIKIAVMQPKNMTGLLRMFISRLAEDFKKKFLDAQLFSKVQ